MDIDIKELAKAAAEGFDLSKFKGDLVGVKIVENEFGNIEPGGIGIQINNGKDEPIAKSDKDIKSAPEALLVMKDENDTNEQSQEQLNLYAPKKNLQEFLKKAWFAEVRADEKYDVTWTDSFLEALMASEHGDGIACDWAVQGKRNKRTQIMGYIVGLLADAGVLKGSYDSIAKKMGMTEDPRSFSRYMGQGKHQPYSDWVREWING